MQYEVIGWTYYEDPDYAEIEDAEKVMYLRTPLVREIRKCGYRFSGDRHAGDRGIVPVFNSGEKLCVSPREWGAIMAQAWHEDNRYGMGYNAWQLAWGGDTSGFVYPAQVVDKSRLVPDASFVYEPLPDEEHYMIGPSSYEEYAAMMKGVARRMHEENLRVMYSSEEEP